MNIYINLFNHTKWEDYKQRHPHGYLEFFGGHNSFFVGPLTPVLRLLVTFPLGFKARVGSLICAWQRCNVTFPEIHLWYNTCWPLGGQHGSPAILFYVPTSRNWNWHLSCCYCLTVWDQADTLLNELCRLGWDIHMLVLLMSPQKWTISTTKAQLMCSSKQSKLLLVRA